MLVKDFDYYLPKELIAQEPTKQRDESRLLVVPKHGSIQHRRFSDLPEFLNPGDVLVLNDTRVMKARLLGVREDTGGKVEVLLLSPVSQADNTWQALVKPGKRGQRGTRFVFDPRLSGEVTDIVSQGVRVIRFSSKADMGSIVEEIGKTPLPPYIEKDIDDMERYQTVYASKLGSAAAPTAGLHFTPELLDAISEKGVNIARLTLHVGLGTFRPVKVDVVEEHKMHEEYFEVTEEAAHIVNQAIAGGGRVVAVGTTTVRTLESLPMTQDGKILASRGSTSKFIYPGYRFKVVDSIVTNFHLPKSTLLMLVSAFSGYQRIMSAYEIAVKERYRFFSFGDAMLLL
ncbi:MAG TPA: tRNA preQ1(34) S-adenosylmethionine ribosyltransferase-isomerase QueA [Bacillota bacterium]|mgnify:CR=1 FL=1|nr:tRNA preQ1(34) S-adenosylmethionine ribosyltransferase-isomerase QueA [Bacillota bacterium]